jgi:hypothetical protein
MKRSLHLFSALALAAAVGALSVYGLLYMQTASPSRLWPLTIARVATASASLVDKAFEQVET